MRQKTRQLALCGVLCALAEVILLLEGIVPAALYCCPILAMAVLLPVREECGTKMALTAYAAVAILALLMAADKELAGVYLFWGWYPSAQSCLDRVRPKALQLLVKLFLWNLSTAALYALLLLVFQLEAVAAEFAGASALVLGSMALMANLVFLLTDLVLHRFAGLWHQRLRKLLF